MKTKHKFRNLRSGIKLVAILGLMLAPMRVRADDDIDSDDCGNSTDLDDDTGGAGRIRNGSERRLRR